MKVRTKEGRHAEYLRRKERLSDEEKERVKKQGAAYYEKNKDKKQVVVEIWRGKNKEKVKSYLKKYREANKEKAQATSKAWHKTHPGYNIEKNHGITWKQWNELLIAQAGRCWLCGKHMMDKCTKDPVVDHDHATGEIRGLAHTSCNRAFGFVNEDPDVLHSLMLRALEIRRDKEHDVKKRD